MKANHQQAKQYYWKAEFQIKLNSGRRWKVIVEFAREENDAPDWNVRFQIKTLIFGDVEIFAYFLGGGLEIVSSSHGTIDRALALLRDDLAANEETVEGILAKFLFATRPPYPGVTP